MDIRQLKYFVAIADNGSLSQAALHLHVVQSALSHNLSQLEEELKTQLFHRKPRGVELTRAGTVLYEYAQTILNTVSEARQEILQSSDDVLNQVWVGLTHTATKIVLPELPQRLVSDFPNVRFSIVEDISSVLVEYLLDGQADIALCYNPPNNSQLTSLPILEERVCCVGHKNLLGDHSDPIECDEAANLPLVLPGQGAAFTGIVKRSAQAKSFGASCIMEINSLPALVSVLKAGMGCSIVSEVTMLGELDDSELVLRPLIKPQIKRELHIVHRKNPDNLPILTSIAERISDRIREFSEAHSIEGMYLL